MPQSKIAMLRLITMGLGIVGVAVLLHGCGGGNSPTPSPGPSPGPAGFCEQYDNLPKPPKPGNVMELNGKAWPDACFNVEVAHFFVIGDWGGLCNWGDNECKPGEAGDPGRNMPKGADNMPFAMPNRHGDHYVDLDPISQRLVKDRMVQRTSELASDGPKFIINVGDNFYPGGIDLHCGNNVTGPTNHARQFDQVWHNFYPEDKLNNAEWWGVLGNHDYGGRCFIKGWDKQIEYTWQNPRWVMPAQFWSRKVHFAGFTADFYFIDGNIYDVMSSSSSTNPCQAAQNPGPLCDAAKLPPATGTDPGSCPNTGPSSPAACNAWFHDVWQKNYEWLVAEVPKSTADWQILVNHYPPAYNMPNMIWNEWSHKTGIDLILTGHTHEQSVHYRDHAGGSGIDFGDTAWVISGGGGGISAVQVPNEDGLDDSYGFMDMEISKDSLKITAYSHGGTTGNLIIRNQTTVRPNKNRQGGAANDKAAPIV